MEYWMASNESGHDDREEAIQEVLRDPGTAILFVGYPQWLLRFAASCCILFMIVGIPGNLFTIVALTRTRKLLRNATAVFIINLSVSDLMFCCFNLPLATSTFWHSSWHHGALLCRLFPLLRYGLVAVSLFTILAITINRYVMIGHPRLYPRLYGPKYLIPMVLSTWLIAFGVLIVTWFEGWGRFGLDVGIGSCSILPDMNCRSPKAFLFVVAFLIPCLAIVVCYARIFYIVRKTASKSRKGNASSGDNIGSNREILTSARNCDEEQSVLASSCAALQSFSKRGIPPANRSSCSRTPSRSVSWDENPETIEQENPSGGVLAQQDASDPKRNDRADRRLPIPRIIEIFEPAKKLSLETRTGDIPYVDDTDVAETVFSLNNDRGRIKEFTGSGTTNARNKLERMASRASFIIESALWVQRLNSRIADSDRLDSSRSNSPDRGARLDHERIRNRRESRFRGGKGSRNLVAPPRMSNKDRKLLKMILIIFSSFLVCYLPITVTKIFEDAIDWRGLNIAGYILIYLTTCINPVIYVVMSSEYRCAYKNALLCRNEADARKRGGKRPR